MNQNKEKNTKNTTKKGFNLTSNFQHLTSNKGITLVALVITVIVLLILAVVAIRAIQNDSIIDYAKNSVDEYERAQANEQSLLQGYIDKIQNSTGQGPVTNPYAPDDWDYAWVCNDGTWGDMLSAGETAKGDIVAKFYKKEEKITPVFRELTLPEGETYHLVLEGSGDMAPLVTTDGSGNMTCAYGALAQFYEFAMGNSTDPGVMPYTTEVTICDGITSIGEGSFYCCISLISITIPNSVKSIEEVAFFDCVALTSITIPNSVTSIGEAAFHYCTALTSITIPDSVTSIGHSAFIYCVALTSVTIPDGVTSIGEYTFYCCAALTSVTIPNSVTSIGEYTFSDCAALTSVTIGNSVTSIGYSAFERCGALKNVYIETTSSELVVGNSVFYVMSSNSTIWVRNESIANALSGKYDSSRTTVSTDYNWTAPTN